jgi:probable rRNA maturation factor
MKLLVVNDCKDSISEEFLQKWIAQISTDLIKKNILKPELTKKELSVVLLDERDAKKINWQFRTRDYAADVLSFQTEDPEGFGELIMCPQVIRRQAIENKIKYEHEMAYMILHGVLHLLGFDHEKGPEDEKKMFSIQDEIFEKHMLKKTKSAPKTKAKVAVLKTSPKTSSKAKANVKLAAKSKVKATRPTKTTSKKSKK